MTADLFLTTLLTPTLPPMFFLLLFLCHWVADFVCQSENMAVNKSKSNKWLFIHVLVYTAVFGVTLYAGVAGGAAIMYHSLPLVYKMMYDSLLAWFWILVIAIGKYALVNGALHALVDYFTSRISARLLQQKKRHLFFVTLGFDQLLHLSALIVTAALML